jgi:bifunctional DNA-binding transcriptional regulator/antitoxin component of YhaV-PrlF toxin-antitoxin module
MGEFIRGEVSGAGRVVVPSELRKEFGIEDGVEVVFSRTQHGIQITTLDQAIRQAQELVRRYVPQGVSLVDDLREARRQDAVLDRVRARRLGAAGPDQ